jgi:hypothetical protein
MLRSADDDGTVFSNVPPRAVFKNQTFPILRVFISGAFRVGPAVFALLERKRFLYASG